MAVTPSSALLSAANAAAGAVSDGQKNAAWCGAIASGIGGGYKIVARRDGVVVLDMTMSGPLSQVSGGLAIPNSYATLNTLLAADIDSGTWTMRVEKSGDPTTYLQGTIGRSGTDFVLSGDLSSEIQVSLGTGIILLSPALDTVTDTFTLALIKSDVNTGLAHEYLMDGVNPDWSWGTYPRAGTGANPPSATGWTSPAWVPWGHCATERNNPPGTHNWRLAVFAIYHAEKRDGQWAFTGTQVTSASQIAGAMYTNYETDANVAANKRTSNGFLEVKFPTDGGSYHWFPSFRTPIPASGATHRAVLLKLALTMDDPGGTDDRASARVCALAGGDYWKSMTQAWDPAVYSNDDFWIGRARRPAIYPEKSWHSAHTMTSDADVNEFIAWVNTLGIL